MRRNGMALTTLLLAGLPAFAQPPRTPPAAPPAAAPTASLDRYLLSWEEQMKKVNNLEAQINRLDRDKTFDTTTRFAGKAQYLKVAAGASPLNLAVLEMYRGKDLAEKYVYTGTYLYIFAPAQKEVRAYELPKPKPGQTADDTVLSLVLGMKAAEAKRRYDLKLFKVDAYYIYVDVLPRFANDRREFQRARLVLDKNTFLPRQLWMEHPNGNESTWDMPTIRTNLPDMKRASFDRPEVPRDWKLVPVAPPAASGTPPPAPPRVIRGDR